ncbi:MAG: NlpC/P60 family protein [Pseudomonadota bacterium]
MVADLVPKDRRLVAPADAVLGIKEVRRSATPLRAEPRPDAGTDTELLFGERVDVFEESEEGWARVRLHTDGYVGWCSADALGSCGGEVTHFVSAIRTYVYPGPSIKLPPLDLVSITSPLRVTGIADGFAALATGGFVFTNHLSEINAPVQDWVSVAERFIATPYLWGGRTSLGLDCSGLVQLALLATGRPCPRDSDMQEGRIAGVEGVGKEIDRPVAPGDFARGDLLFWAGHVALALGDGRLLHANAHHMSTEIEPIAQALDRIAGAGLPLRSVRRLV